MRIPQLFCLCDPFVQTDRKNSVKWYYSMYVLSAVQIVVVSDVSYVGMKHKKIRAILVSLSLND
jgi:hypothetical protein